MVMLAGVAAAGSGPVSGSGSGAGGGAGTGSGTGAVARGALSSAGPQALASAAASMAGSIGAWNRMGASGSVEQAEDLVDRQCLDRVAGAAGHGLGMEERVEDGFLGGFDGRTEQGGHGVIAQHGCLPQRIAGLVRD